MYTSSRGRNGHLLPAANKAAVDRLDDASVRNPSATDALVR